MNWYKIYSQKNEVSINYLMNEAKKYDTFEDFKKAYIIQIKHGLYWHLTDNPNFNVDLEKGPRDMSSLTFNDSFTPGALMITSHLEYWDDFYNEDEITRGYAALIDMSESDISNYYQVNRGFGNEFFVNDASQVKVVGVYPINEAKRINDLYNELLPSNDDELREIFEKSKNI